MKHFIAALSLLTFAACGHGRITPGDQGKATTEAGEKSISTDVTWVKNKGDTVDILMSLKNGYDFPVAWKRGHVKLSFNGREGTIRKYEFTGQLEPGEVQKALVIFDFTPEIPREGKIVLTMGPFTPEAKEGVTTPKSVPALKLEMDSK